MIFTIAIPTYNNEKTIEKTILSCLNQDFKDEFEVLVVNNHCTDGTSKILEKFKNKISIVENDYTVSLFENHNVCFRNAKGDYVIFCHSDDTLLPDALIKYNSILKKRNYPKKYVMWGRSMFRDFGHNWSNGGFQLNEIAAGIKAFGVFHIGGLTPSGTCYSRESFINCGGFLEMKDRLTPSDLTTMWILCLHSFEFEMVDRIFFTREFASTAKLLNQNAYDDAMKGAFDVLINTIGEKEKKTIISNLLMFNNFISPIVVKTIIEKSLESRKQTKKILLKYLLKNPSYFFKRQYLKLLF